MVVFSAPNNATSFMSQIFYINSLTDTGSGGLIGLGIVFLLFFVLFLITKAFSFEKGFAVSSMISSIIGVLLAGLTYQSQRLISNWQIGMFVMIFIISLYLLMKETTSFE